MSVTLELPLPPRELSPNSRRHWAVKAIEARKYRERCGWIAVVECNNTGPLSEPVEARITFVFPDRRRRDMDNALASIKAGIDGIVDSGLIPGDDAERFRIVEVGFEVGTPCVRITLESKAWTS